VCRSFTVAVAAPLASKLGLERRDRRPLRWALVLASRAQRTDLTMSHEKIRSTFDTWADNGRAESMERGHGDVVRQVIARIAVRAGDKILDLGCGNGWATRMLARTAPGVAAVGIDVAPAMVARAEQQTSYTIRARYEVAAIEALPFTDASFQRIFSMEAIYYSPDLDRALAECARVLAPGGTIDLVVDCFAESPSTRGWSALVGLPMHCLSEEEWRTRLERAGFHDVVLARVIDSRGPGERASFTPSAHSPDWETHAALHAAGSLWIHGLRGA
jgi:ubiquinone/menaquinone biosynthesis C-methylase UbiE